MPEQLLPGTEVEARGLRWEVVSTQQLGQQTLYRLRGLEGVTRGQELDLLSPFEHIAPLQAGLNPERETVLSGNSSHWTYQPLPVARPAVRGSQRSHWMPYRRMGASGAHQCYGPAVTRGLWRGMPTLRSRAVIGLEEAAEGLLACHLPDRSDGL